MPKPEAGQPVVYAEQAGDSTETLLIYNHYDVQPAEPLDEWDDAPLRAAAQRWQALRPRYCDDKGQPRRVASRPCRAIKKPAARCPLNVKFLIEGDEEIGSPKFEAFVTANRELLQRRRLHLGGR